MAVAAVEDNSSSLLADCSALGCRSRKSAKEIEINVSSGSAAVALLDDALVNQRVMFCCVILETTLIDLTNVCEFNFELVGRFGTRYDHSQLSGLITFWRVMTKLFRLDFAILGA